MGVGQNSTPRGPQLLVHVSICYNSHLGYQFLTHSHIRYCPTVLNPPRKPCPKAQSYGLADIMLRERAAPGGRSMILTEGVPKNRVGMFRWLYCLVHVGQVTLAQTALYRTSMSSAKLKQLQPLCLFLRSSRDQGSALEKGPRHN